MSFGSKDRHYHDPYRSTLFASPDSPYHSAAKLNSVHVNPGRFVSEHDEASLPHYQRPIHHLDQNHERNMKKIESENGRLQTTFSRDSTEELCDYSDAVHLLLNQNLSESERDNIVLHYAFPSFVLHLEEILESLNNTVKDFQLGNKRNKKSHFDKNLSPHSRSTRRENRNDRQVTGLNEQMECEELSKRIDCLLHKWRRQTSLSVEVGVLVREMISKEKAHRERLECLIQQRETELARNTSR